MIAPPNRLLVIDDDAGIRALIREVAEERDFAVLDAADPDEFLAAYRAFSPTVVVLDLVMPEADGIELLRVLAEKSCTSKVLVMSGVDSKVLTTAQRLGKDLGLNMLAAMQKPIRVDDLEARLEKARADCKSISEESLAIALKAGQLGLLYQPKINLHRGESWRVQEVEALVRWNHPSRGTVPPAEFIPLAEKTGLIAPLTDFVFAAAIEQQARWRKAELDLSVAVNLAPQLLTDLHLPDRVAQQLRSRNVDPRRLIIEITESAAMDESVKAAEILTRFRLKDVGLSLDDFGTGYSSLVELYRLPFNELKIDRSFVAEIEESEEARIIVRSIVDLARNLGLSSCAEGAESAQALDYLSAIGCDKGQGYFISKPIPAEDVPRFVEDWGERHCDDLAVEERLTSIG